MIGHFSSSSFLEIVLSYFPNPQSEIMIDAYLIDFLYNYLELGFHFYFP